MSNSLQPQDCSPNPTKQFTSPVPNMPPSVLQNNQAVRKIPHRLTGGTLPALAHAQISHTKGTCTKVTFGGHQTLVCA